MFCSVLNGYIRQYVAKPRSWNTFSKNSVLVERFEAHATRLAYIHPHMIGWSPKDVKRDRYGSIDGASASIVLRAR